MVIIRFHIINQLTFVHRVFFENVSYQLVECCQIAYPSSTEWLSLGQCHLFCIQKSISGFLIRAFKLFDCTNLWSRSLLSNFCFRLRRNYLFSNCRQECRRHHDHWQILTFFYRAIQGLCHASCSPMECSHIRKVESLLEHSLPHHSLKAHTIKSCSCFSCFGRIHPHPENIQAEAFFFLS